METPNLNILISTNHKQGHSSYILVKMQPLNKSIGVPIVARCLTNPTRNHEGVGLIPALAQWVNDPALPGPVV